MIAVIINDLYKMFYILIQKKVKKKYMFFQTYMDIVFIQKKKKAYFILLHNHQKLDVFVIMLTNYFMAVITSLFMPKGFLLRVFVNARKKQKSLLAVRLVSPMGSFSNRGGQWHLNHIYFHEHFMDFSTLRITKAHSYNSTVLCSSFLHDCNSSLFTITAEY